MLLEHKHIDYIGNLIDICTANDDKYDVNRKSYLIISGSFKKFLFNLKTFITLVFFQYIFLFIIF